MGELAVRHRCKKGHDGAQMQAKRQRQGRGFAQNCEAEAARTNQEKECDKPTVHGRIVGIAMLWIAIEIQPSKADRSNHETNSTERTEYFGEADPVIGR